jgi:hypothetical protein
MLRSNLIALALGLSVAGLAGCSGGPDSTEPTPAPASSSTAKEPAKSTDPTTPAEDTAKPSVGAQCTAYLACCDEVAKSTPAAAGSCDSTRTQLEAAQEKGTSTASLESSCKQALASMKSAGFCK